MPKKQKNLITQIANIDNLRSAFLKTARGKRQSFGYLEFKEYGELNLKIIQQELLDGGYKIGPYRYFTLYEPKERQIAALNFKDRLVQHALCNIIEPIMDATLLPNTFACRKGMGTHSAIKYIQSNLRQHNFTHFLKTDFKSYFKSISCAIAVDLYSRKIGCRSTMDLIKEIIPPERIGIPIGSLTSQLTANLIGGLADRFIHFELKNRYWARYMDDIVILDNDLGKLRADFLQLQEFSNDVMKLKISRWHAHSTNRGINFLGFRIWNTHKLLRKDSIRRARRKIKFYIENDRKDDLKKFLASWSGHVNWANSRNLINNVNKILADTELSL